MNTSKPYSEPAERGHSKRSQGVSISRFVFRAFGLLLVILLSGLPASAGFDVRSFGAVGNGKADDTRAVQKAIDKCAASGGGTVCLPAGKYLCRPLFLKSNVTLHIDAGATLLGSTEYDKYPTVRGRWEGVEVEHKAALVTAINAHNITVEGRGTIDGQGEVWWNNYRKWYKLWQCYQAEKMTAPISGKEEEYRKAQQCRFPRPRLLNFIKCHNVRVTGVTLANSPAWTLHPIYCENVVIDGVTIRNPTNSPNTDGINPDSCRRVRIYNCAIDVGDDCITLKSGKGEDGRRVGKPCEDIVITNCVMYNGHGGVVIGSEMSGGVRNVAISNCVFNGTERGLRLKTARGRGGYVENITASNLIVRGALKEAFIISMAYSGRVVVGKPEPVNEGTPVFRNISISDVRVEGADCAFLCEGLPEMPVNGVSVSNLRANDTRQGMLWFSARDIDLSDVEVNCREGASLNCRYVDRIEVSGFKTRKPLPGVPVVAFDHVTDSWLCNCRAYPGTDTFLGVSGSLSSGILVSNCDLTAAKVPFSISSADTGAVKMVD